MGLREHVERQFDQWSAEQGEASAPSVRDLRIANAMTELAADGVTNVAQLRGFDLEGIWER